jgi:AcrR family transcriptional regulator
VEIRSLSDSTRNAVLDAAWDLIASKRRTDIGMAEIARTAGVSRQTLYLAFGNRAGLLLAMAKRADSKSPYLKQMHDIGARPETDRDLLTDYVDAWLHHLPEIYAAASLLGAAALTDPDAAEVFNDRMVGNLYARFCQLFIRLKKAGLLAPGWTVARAADFMWSATHIDAWRHLVVERGWTPKAFREDRKRLAASLLKP